MNGQTDGCSGPLTEDGLALPRSTSVSTLLLSVCWRVILSVRSFFLYLVFLFCFSFPQFFGIGFSLLLASVSSHLTEGPVSYVSLRDQTLGGEALLHLDPRTLLRLEITL